MLPPAKQSKRQGGKRGNTVQYKAMAWLVHNTSMSLLSSPSQAGQQGLVYSDSRDSTVAVTPALRVALPKIQKIHRELLDCPVSAEVYTASLCMHWKVCRCQRIRYVRDLQVEMCRNCNTLKLDTLSWIRGYRYNIYIYIIILNMKSIRDMTGRILSKGNLTAAFYWLSCQCQWPNSCNILASTDNDREI